MRGKCVFLFTCTNEVISEECEGCCHCVMFCNVEETDLHDEDYNYNDEYNEEKKMVTGVKNASVIELCEERMIL